MKIMLKTHHFAWQYIIFISPDSLFKSVENEMDKNT